MKMKKKCFWGFGILCVVFVLVSCNAQIGNKGDKILFVQLSDNASSEKEIREALEKGGQVTLSTDVLKSIDSNFESKYAVLNSNGKYFIRPAILNFVGDRGWNLLQRDDSDDYLFTKKR